MKHVFFLLKILVALLSIVLVLYSTVFSELEKIHNIFTTFNINVDNIDSIRSDLNQIFNEIAEKTNADIVWVNILHQKSEVVAITGPISKEDILLTALHHWIKPNHKIQIRLAANQPIADLPQIDETLAGKCIGRINSTPNPYELIEAPIDRLVLRCPLYDNNNNLIGIYGMSYFGFNQALTDKTQFVIDHSLVLKSYRTRILDIILN